MFVVQGPKQLVLCEEDRAKTLLSVLGAQALRCDMACAFCKQQS